MWIITTMAADSSAVGGAICCTIIFIILPIIFIAVIVGIVNAFNKARTTLFRQVFGVPSASPPPPAYYPPPPQPTIIVREIVKIPCKYCNSLVPQEELNCPFCGAPTMR